MNQFDDQTVFITGAARGQGRAHAVGFARAGANVVAVDACVPVDGARYPMASRADLEQTADAVRAVGGRCVVHVADVRSQEELDAAVESGVDAFGRIDHVIANAGIFTSAERTWTMDEASWNDVIDINLSGVWRTCKAVIPTMIDGGRGGSISLIASSNGYRGEFGHPSYNASKLGLVALMRTLAAELGEHEVRVNTVHPMTVKTPLMYNDFIVGMFAPGETTATVSEADWWGSDGLKAMSMLPVGAIEPEVVTGVLQFLASEAGRYITASEVPVDAGYIMKMSG